MEDTVLDRKKDDFLPDISICILKSSSVARNEEREKEREFIGGEEAKDNQITEVTMTSKTEKKKTQSRVGPPSSPTFPTLFINRVNP